MTGKKLFNKVLWTTLASVFLALFLVMTVAVWAVLPQFDAALNMAFGTSRTETVGASEFADFKSDYEFMNANNRRIGEDLYKEDAAMIEEAEGAGAVLLWNKANALPLKDTETDVTCFGHASANIVECGSGSGYVQTYNYRTNAFATTTFKAALESRGFSVNSAMWNFYTTGAGSADKYKMTSPEGQCTQWRQWWVNEVPWNILTATETGSFASYDDVAFVVLARSGGEHSDLHYNYASADDKVGNNDKGTVENTSANGGYLGLTDAEESVLQNVCALRRSGTFKKVVLLLNTGNSIQMADVRAYYGNIDACMWIGQPGSTGINAVVDLLKGKDTAGNPLTPSGRLTDTWAYNLNSAPSAQNDGNYTYESSSLMNSVNWNQSYASGFGTNANHNKYMVYQEGIYVGYRYYETRYADAVAPSALTANASGEQGSSDGAAWSYEKEVAFPFGYGLSYAEFTYNDDFAVTKNADGDYVVSGSVTNTSTNAVAGKEVIQIYLQKPYTAYDKTHKVEKSAIELVGYDKTGLLQKGETYRYEITIPAEYFKTYDANNKKTYIVEKGVYYLTVGTDVHVALNNILLAANSSAAVSQSVLGGNVKSSSLGAKFAKTITIANDDYTTYSVSRQTGYPVTNQFDSGDINKYANKGTNSVTYLSRSDWGATYPSTQTLTLNQKMAQDLVFANHVGDDSDYDMPDYQLVYGSDTEVVKYGSVSEETYIADYEAGDVVACQFENAPIDPARDAEEHEDEDFDGLTYEEYWTEMWDMLLDEMSQNEQMLMAVDSYHWIHGAASIRLPDSKQENGPVGITKRTEAIFSLPNDETLKGENGTGWIWVAYPCAGILGASFDKDVAKRVGEHKSEDMLYLGYNGIYGPGVNLHRSPFSGRAFEYPSEDPFLAGTCEAYESIGIESKGCMAYAKHYALNDQETNRVNCGIWSNEQASRELYLRPFEIVFTEGKASATMNSFTRIGTRWSGGFYNMMTTVLRDEWGWDGLVISDWITKNSAMSEIDGIMAGTGTFDGNGTIEKFTQYNVQNNAKFAQALRTATKYTVYNVVRTNVMNGFSVDTKVVVVTPWWETMFKTIDFTLGGLFAVFAGMAVASFVLAKKQTAASVAPAVGRYAVAPIAYAGDAEEEKSPYAQF